MAASAVTNYKLISEEINTILAEVLGKFLVAGAPMKHGGLRFLDIMSAKTFGFERSQEVKDSNLLILSAPLDITPDRNDPNFFSKERQEEVREGARARIEEALKAGPHAKELHNVIVRPSPDPGKSRKMFVEIQYLIPTSKLISDKAILDYANKHSLTNTSEAVKRVLREYIVPMAKDTMDHFIVVIRGEHGLVTPATQA
jgi:hypothetical protein